MVERQLPKLNVAGSIPVSRSKKICGVPNALSRSACAPIALRKASYLESPTSHQSPEGLGKQGGFHVDGP